MNEHTGPHTEMPISDDGPPDFVYDPVGGVAYLPEDVAAEGSQAERFAVAADRMHRRCEGSPLAMHRAQAHQYRKARGRWARHITPRAKTTPPKVQPNAKPRAPRQHRRTAKTSGGQDPGGDPDPGDLDPIQRRVNELVAVAPPFSPGQAKLLSRLFGGA